MEGATNPGVLWITWKKRTKQELRQLRDQLREQDGHHLAAAQVELEAAMNSIAIADTPQARIRCQRAMDEFKTMAAVVAEYRQDGAFDLHAREAETSTSYFFRPIESLRRVPIDRLRMPDGIITDNAEEVETGFLQYWGEVLGDPRHTQLFETDAVSQERLLDSIDRTISPEDAAGLDEPLSAAELTTAIKSMRGTSASGLDGLTAKLYQIAPTIFGEILACVFRYQFDRGCLLYAQRKTCLTYLFKKGERTEPRNYRPIALMDVDVKILTKALALRLRAHLSALIHEEQQGFVPGRSLHNHLRFLDDLQHQLKTQDTDGYAMFLDFEKAYDRVDWAYLRRVLTKMGVGPSFTKWVQILYDRPSYILQINGRLSSPLRPTRGVKQGDPLSPLLFLLSIEPLGNLLRRNADRGIPVSPTRTATGLYFADDSTVLSSTTAGLDCQLDLVEVYCAGSGAKVNIEKSKLLSLTGRAAPTIRGVSCLPTTESISYLGLPQGNPDHRTALVDHLEVKIFARLRQWKSRARTLKGRLLLVNTVVLSVLWHYTFHIDVPDTTVRRWQRAMTAFILSRKHEPADRYMQLVSLSILSQRREQNGLGIPNLSRSLTLQRVRAIQRFVSASQQVNIPLWVLPAHTGLTHVFSTPIWLTTNPLFSVQRGQRNGTLLSSVTGSERIFRLKLAREYGFHRLSALIWLWEAWPSKERFVQQHRHCLRWAERQSATRWIERVYDDITIIHSRFPEELQLNAMCTIVAPAVGVLAKGRHVFFPNVRRADLRVALPAPQPKKSHPATGHDPSLDDAGVRRILEYARTQSKWLLPVYHDVWTRLVFRLLPVRSRLFFLERRRPDITICPHDDCGHVETYTHLFLECHSAAAVWSTVWPDWQPLIRGPLDIKTLISRPKTRRPAAYNDSEELATLWHMMRVITIRVLWMDRNKVIFEGTRRSSPTTLVAEIYGLFAAHYRALLRHTDSDEHIYYHRILLELLKTPSFGTFFLTRRALFSVRRRVELPSRRVSTNHQ